MVKNRKLVIKQQKCGCKEKMGCILNLCQVNEYLNEPRKRNLDLYKG